MSILEKLPKSYIEQEFHCEGSFWNDNKFFTLNPCRDDKHVGSFYISTSGQWYDYATKEMGDHLSLKIGKSKYESIKKYQVGS